MAVFIGCLAQERACAEAPATPAGEGQDIAAVSVATNAVDETPEPASPASSNLIWGLKWGNGLEYKLGSGQRVSRLTALHPEAEIEPYHGKVGLKLHLDAARHKTGSGLQEIPDDAGLRRARLYTTGNFFLRVPVFYKVEIEMANNDFYVRETYLSLATIPYLQRVKFGFFKAPMTMEGYTGSGDTLFLERAAPVEAFGPGIMFGIQASGNAADKDMSWALGWFGDGGQNDVSEGSRSLTRAIGRLTWLPVYDIDGDQTVLIHFGGSAQYMYATEGSVQYRSRPENYFAPRLLDTGRLDAREAAFLGLEFAAERGPLSLHSEFLQASVHEEDDANPLFHGFYVAGSWLLTGESRPYNRYSGTFGRVIPRRKFSLRERTFGAWELVARLSHLDLNSKDVAGGEMQLGTIGVNGYLTSRLRVMVDYTLGRVDHGENNGDLRTLEGRLQYEF